MLTTFQKSPPPSPAITDTDKAVNVDHFPPEEKPPVPVAETPRPRTGRWLKRSECPRTQPAVISLRHKENSSPRRQRGTSFLMTQSSLRLPTAWGRKTRSSWKL
jgi:hypothetical protein